MNIPVSLSLSRSNRSRRILTAGAAALLAVLGAVPSVRSQIVVSGSMTYTQNFDSLGVVTNPWTDGVTLPGWFAGINANNTVDGDLTISDGSNGALTALLNLGTTDAADRALGSKVTNTGSFANIAFGVLFQNTSGKSLDITNIGYTGELWRSNTTTGGAAEQWVTFTKVSASTFTDVEPGTSSATANAGSFTAAPLFNWSSPVAANTPVDTQKDGNLAANRTVISADPNIIVAPGQFFMFRWVDTNLGGTDGHQGIDDFSISFTAFTNLVYNLAHTVGTAPNGVLEVSANQYWLDGANGAGFANDDRITFSQAGTATISVPANVAPSLMTVSAASGTYTIGGAGKIAGTLTKSGAGTLVLTSANSFTSTTISGGTIELQTAGALGPGLLTFSGTGTLRIRDNGTGDNGTLAYGNNITVSASSTLNLDHAAGGTSVGNTVVFGNLTTGVQTLTVTGANGYKAQFDGPVTLTGNANISTNSEVVLQGAISGSFALTKAGTGRLTINSINNTYTTTAVNAGTLGGTGILPGSITVNNTGTLAPGNGAGIFATNASLTLAAGSTVSLELDHGGGPTPVAGVDYDQMKVGSGTGPTSTGAVNLGGGALVLTIGTGVQVNDIFFVILNDGTDAVTGTFNGLAQGAQFSVSGQTFRISYTADSVAGTEIGGNDIALVVVPEPGVIHLALFGIGGLLLGRRRR
jgi:autotransporter-associated beta strand protein